MDPVSGFLERPRFLRLARLPSSAGIGPVNSLPQRIRNSRFARSPSSDGSVPVSSLCDTTRFFRFARRPSSGGMDPVRRFVPSQSVTRLPRFPSSRGIDPSSWLFQSDSVSSFASAPSSGGIGPVRLLVLRKSAFSSVRAPSSGGIVPVSPSWYRGAAGREANVAGEPRADSGRPRTAAPGSAMPGVSRQESRAGPAPGSTPASKPWSPALLATARFPSRFSTSRLFRRPSSGGMAPVRALWWRSSTRRAVRCPSSVGMVPVSSLWPRSSLVTRPRSSVVTPYHSPTGASVPQWSDLTQLDPRVPSKSAISTSAAEVTFSLRVAASGAPAISAPSGTTAMLFVPVSCIQSCTAVKPAALRFTSQTPVACSTTSRSTTPLNREVSASSRNSSSASPSPA